MQSFPSGGSASPTVAYVVRSYLVFSKSRLASETYKIRCGYLNSLAAELGEMPVTSCKPIHVLLWIENHPEWASDWTKHSIITYVQAAFNWAVDTAEIIDKNPFRKITHPEGMARRDISPDEFQRMLRGTTGRRSRYRPSPGARMREILVFLRVTGCRPSEAAKLQWKHIDADKQIAILPQHKTAKSQKQPLPRVIHLHPVAIKLLLRIANRREGEYVFLTYRRTPWNRHTLAQRISRARGKENIPMDATLYGLRHAFGTRAIVNGCDIKTLATLMGHTTTKMTERYIHLAGKSEHLSAALEIINRARRNIPPTNKGG